MRALLACLLLLFALPAHGQDIAPLELPWKAVAPHVQGDEVRVATVAGADERIGRFAPRRASARSAAEARAREALHRWIDEALAPLRAHPRAAQAAHDAVEAHAEVEGVRPLMDGGAVLVLSVPLSALREACPLEGAPW